MTATASAPPRGFAAAQKRVTVIVNDLATQAVIAWEEAEKAPDPALRDQVDRKIQTWVWEIETEDAALKHLTDILRFWRSNPCRFSIETPRDHWQPQLGPIDQAPSGLHDLLAKWLKELVWSKAAVLAG